MMDDYVNDILSKANQEYPFLARHNPAVMVNANGGAGYAEGYPIGETGKPLGNGKFSRPAELPINRICVEIYKPNEFTHHDLVGEILHGDPVSNQARDRLAKTWSPEQLDVLKKRSLDYAASLEEKQSPARALQNATDAAIRGVVVKQWPEEINQELKYSPQQMTILDSLQKYMASPPARKDIIEQQINQLPQE